MPDQPEDSDAFKRVRSRDSQPIKVIDAGPYAFFVVGLVANYYPGCKNS